MRNGNSSLIPSMKANTLASLVYLFTAVFGILNGFWGFLALVTFVCAVVLIFIEKNSFVRRACVQVIFLHLCPRCYSVPVSESSGSSGLCIGSYAQLLRCSRFTAPTALQWATDRIFRLSETLLILFVPPWAYNLPRALFTGRRRSPRRYVFVRQTRKTMCFPYKRI